MKTVKKLFHFYITSNLHVSIMGTILLIVSYIYYKQKIEVNYLSFIFFSTLFSYIFIRIFEGIEYEKQTCISLLKSFYPRLIQESKAVIALLFLSFFGFVYFALQIDLHHLWIVLPALFLTIAYVFPVVKRKGEWLSIRAYPKLKIFSIALSWGIVGVLFPLQNHLNELNVWICFIQRILLIMALVIPFDIRDMDGDTLAMMTLPQSIGITNSIKRGYRFLVIFLILGLLKTPIQDNLIISDLVVFAITAFFLYKSKPPQAKYFASFWVEAVPLFWLSFVLIIMSYT